MSMPKQQPGRSKQDYATPDNFIRAVKKRLGISRFIMDLAADGINTKAASWYDIHVDSLEQDWPSDIGDEEWAWLNPPYADIEPWAIRCHQAATFGAHIAFLVPASVGANWFRDYVFHSEFARVLFLNGRLAFMPDKPTWLYPKDCMLVLYDPDTDKCIRPKFNVWDWRKDV